LRDLASIFFSVKTTRQILQEKNITTDGGLKAGVEGKPAVVGKSAEQLAPSTTQNSVEPRWPIALTILAEPTCTF